MIKKYKHLSRLPHGDNFLSVPISGLFTALSDRSKIFDNCKKSFGITIKSKHQKASSRIADCTGYLATISHRLINDSPDELFMSKHLDWESLINYSQIILGSFSILTPLFYGLQEEYYRKDDNKDTYSVNSFNNLKEWFEYHSLNDELTKKYMLTKEKDGWYKLLNLDRINFIHGCVTPSIISKKIAKDLGFSMTGDKILKLKNNKQMQMQPPNLVEEETKEVLRNVFDFLTFSNFFFVTKLEKRNIFISRNNQFKCRLDDGLYGSILKWFNGIIF